MTTRLKIYLNRAREGLISDIVVAEDQVELHEHCITVRLSDTTQLIIPMHTVYYIQADDLKESV